MAFRMFWVASAAGSDVRRRCQAERSSPRVSRLATALGTPKPLLPAQGCVSSAWTPTAPSHPPHPPAPLGTGSAWRSVTPASRRLLRSRRNKSARHVLATGFGQIDARASAHLTPQSPGGRHSVQRFAPLVRRVIYRLPRSQPGKPRGPHSSFSPGSRSRRHCRPRWHRGPGSGNPARLETATRAGFERSRGSRSSAPARFSLPRPSRKPKNTLIHLQWSGKCSPQAGNLRQIPRETRGVSRGCGPHTPPHPSGGNSAVPARHEVSAEPWKLQKGKKRAENPLYSKAFKGICRRMERGFDLSFFPKLK